MLHKHEVLKRGSEHYKEQTIEPIQYILANDLGFCEGNIVKYITRWDSATGGGLKDLEKIKHYVDFLIAKEGEENGKQDQAVSDLSHTA